MKLLPTQNQIAARIGRYPLVLGIKVSKMNLYPSPMMIRLLPETLEARLMRWRRLPVVPLAYISTKLAPRRKITPGLMTMS